MSESHDNLDKLRTRCDRLLDESLNLTAFLQDALKTAVEIEGLAGSAVIEIQSVQEQRILVGQGLESLSRDGFFSLDPDHVSEILQTLQQQRTNIVADRAVPEAGLRPHSIVMTPIAGKNPPFFMIELFTLEVPNAEQAAHLKEVVETISGYVARFVQEQQGEKTPHVTGDFWKQFDIFLLKLQQSLDLKQTVAVAVNDGRTMIGCDRVSIALKYGNQTKVHAVSGQDGVQHRANLVRAMATLAEKVIDIGSPVTYRGTIEDLPPALEQPLADYLSESRTRMVMLIPLREPSPILKDDDEIDQTRKPKERRIMGCLVVEQATEMRPKPAVVERTELLTEHIETSIHNAQRHESIFLLPLWRAIGRGVRWFKGRRLWIAAAILASVTAICLALAFVPWDYRVEGFGQAMPRDQYEIFAPWDGDVVDVKVESGASVKAGSKLLILESDDLDAEEITLVNEVAEKEKLILDLQNRLQQARRTDNAEDEIRIEGELARAEVERDGAQQELEKIQNRKKKLTVTAPADGVVATFQLKQLLENRPVRRGELLLEVMQPKNEWRLELEVPEYRMGHLLQAIHKSETKTLEVEYVLATHVETSHEGTLKLADIATRSNESEEEGTIFEVYVDIDRDDLPSQNIGAEVTAKINCGPKSLFYVLFGDVVEFCQRHLWF